MSTPTSSTTPVDIIIAATADTPSLIDAMETDLTKSRKTDIKRKEVSLDSAGEPAAEPVKKKAKQTVIDVIVLVDTNDKCPTSDVRVVSKLPEGGLARLQQYIEALQSGEVFPPLNDKEEDKDSEDEDGDEQADQDVQRSIDYQDELNEGETIADGNKYDLLRWSNEDKKVSYNLVAVISYKS